MRQTWRWFGPDDRVSVRDAAQAGAEGIVTALHHLAAGHTWSVEEIRARQREALDGGLAWEVVESVPVSEAIKRGERDAASHLGAWRKTLENLARCGLTTVCYNFMPVLDWTRTQLRHELPNGARAMRFDFTDFAAFDLFVLERRGAAADYPEEVLTAAEERAHALDDEARVALAANIAAGLPGSAAGYSIEDLRKQLDAYQGSTAEQLRSRLIDFLSEVVPTAERLGMRLCCHPDDPPWPLLGLPRIMSDEQDYRAVLDAVDVPANGMTFCAGALGARFDNDLPGIVERLGPRIHFVHLRSVSRDGDTVPCSFHEDNHLDGDGDMVAIVAALLREESRRKAEGRADSAIPMRADHGQELLDDLSRGANPGYPAIGRLKGLAELRGVAAALDRVMEGSLRT